MDIWSELEANGYAAVQLLQSQQISEGLQLEFKSKAIPDSDALSKEDRRGLGASLSAMSNAIGGVLVLGIVTEKGPDDLDIVKDVQDLPNVTALARRVEALLPELLTPPNNDIHVRAVEKQDTTTGVVAIRIGASAHRPHMSLAPGHQRYYQRARGQQPAHAGFPSP